MSIPKTVEDAEIATTYLAAAQTWQLVMTHITTLSPEERRELIEWILEEHPKRRGMWAWMGHFKKRMLRDIK